MKLITRLFFVVFLCGVHTAQAGERSLETLVPLNQDQFEALGKDLSAALHYKAIAPAEPLGLLGFDVGVDASSTQLSDNHLLGLVNGSGGSPDSLIMSRLHAHKGLPFGWDVGASYGMALDSNIKMLGAEVRYAIWQGNIVWPALAVRGSYTQMSGVDVLDMHSKALELTASKGFLMLTPYAGVGYVWSSFDPKQTGVNLQAEHLEQTKVFIGSHLNILGLNAGLELDNTDGRNTVSLKLSIRF